MARFDASIYSQYRPLYPKKIFEQLIPKLKGEFTALDLGGGTGFSARSFLQVFPNARLTLVEPDAGMLREAKMHLESFSQVESWIHSASEDVAVADESVDLVLVGSAWHWMNSQKLIPLLFKALNRDGLVHIFEYQFPKCESTADLNDWVRRKFNLEWKAQNQTPRGKLRELVAPLSSSGGFELVEEQSFDHRAEFDLEQFAGVIFSQARYLFHEELLLEHEKELYRKSVKKELEKWFPNGVSLPFFYRMTSFTFKKCWEKATFF